MDRRRILLMLGVVMVPAGLSLAAVVMLHVRMNATGTETFSFLIWNLFLAWCPVVFAVIAFALHRLRAPLVAIAPVLSGWLLFLPNSPYLVTDLIHLRWADDRIRELDHLMLGTFAACGLALGCAALLVVHIVLRERFGSVLAWLGISASCFASGAGIYAGRVLRLNSWDALTDPWLLPRIVAARVQDPLGNPELLAVVGGFAVLLMAAYLPLYWFAR